jgi:myosin V
LEASLLAEKQQSTAIFSQLAEAQQDIEVLQKKFADANRTNDLLQDSLKRLFSHVTLITQRYHASTISDGMNCFSFV